MMLEKIIRIINDPGEFLSSTSFVITPLGPDRVLPADSFISRCHYSFQHYHLFHCHHDHLFHCHHDPATQASQSVYGWGRIQSIAAHLYPSQHFSLVLQRFFSCIFFCYDRYLFYIIIICFSSLFFIKSKRKQVMLFCWKWKDIEKFERNFSSSSQDAPDHPALMVKRDGSWKTWTYEEVESFQYCKVCLLCFISCTLGRNCYIKRGQYCIKCPLIILFILSADPP